MEKQSNETIGRDFVYDLFQGLKMVGTFFKDDHKTAFWFVTRNPNLGNAIPLELYLVGRGKKVNQFILACLGENE